jgi:hypothetical protein
MPLPSPSDACIELDINTGLDVRLNIDLGGLDLSGLNITFPGGVNLSALAGLKVPNPGDLTGKFLGEVNAALMPLVPLFDLIDLLLTFKAIFDAVLSLNPPKIAAKIDAMLPKLDKFKLMIPQLSIPILLKGIVSVLLLFVIGFRAQLQAIIDAQARIDLSGARATALGSLDLQVAVDCAQASLDLQFQAMGNGAAPLNRLIGLLNLLAGLAGLPEVPTLDDLGESAEAALAPIDALISALRALYVAIP